MFCTELPRVRPYALAVQMWNNANVNLLRARELVSIAEYASAESLLLRHLRSNPKDPDALHLMCYILAHTGRTEQALFYAQRAAAAAPTNPNTLANLGTTLLSLNREEEALDTLRRAVALEPRGASAHHALALALNSTRRYTESQHLCEHALEANPDSLPLSLDLADALQGLAHADRAVTLLQRLTAIFPDEPLPAGNLAAAMNYVHSLSPSDIFNAHARFAATLSKNLPPPKPPPITDPNPDRTIRVGIIIPDLTQHSVAFFARPWLERFDLDRFVLFLYYTSSEKDVAPAWLTVSHSARRIAWEQLPKLDALIRADRLDMLIDLCGMTSQHRLPLMHLKPAPIQLTYAGYPNTTGLSSIDYRIVDRHTDPIGAEQFATEKLLRLDPCFLCYTPPLDVPEPTPHSPFPTARPLTFGSFNHLPKLNDPLIALWSRVLAAVPNSRLVLKAQGLHRPEVRAAIESRFASAGVDKSRLDVLPPTATRTDHLNTYSRIDIALDTFPYHGTTTTCEALSMGVPIITLAGQTHVSRVGVSLLNAVNLTDFIASTEDEYVHLAATLAKDPASRHAYRTTLRSRLQSSPLCDGSAFAERFQSHLQTIWRHRCS